MKSESLTIKHEGVDIPCSLYAAESPRAVVLLGHGLGVDRHDETVRRPAQALVAAGLTVVVPELPLHGERADQIQTWDEIVPAWAEFWAGDGRDVLVAEWQAVLSYVQKAFEKPVFYFGLSLGTQYGLLFLAQTGQIEAAVLGLFGSEPLPKSRVMNHCAPRVKLPVFFIQKLDDEIHPAATSTHLYDSIGARKKVLDATAGLHREVSQASIEEACRFLIESAEDRPGAGA